MTLTLLPMSCVGCGVDVARPAIRCELCRKAHDSQRPRKPLTIVERKLAALHRAMGGAR